MIKPSYKYNIWTSTDHPLDNNIETCCTVMWITSFVRREDTEFGIFGWMFVFGIDVSGRKVELF